LNEVQDGEILLRGRVFVKDDSKYGIATKKNKITQTFLSTTDNKTLQKAQLE